MILFYCGAYSKNNWFCMMKARLNQILSRCSYGFPLESKIVSSEHLIQVFLKIFEAMFSARSVEVKRSSI